MRMRLAARLVVAALLTLAPPALAAVTANSIVTPQNPSRGLAQFVQGTDAAGTYKTVYTAGANGSECFALWETNDDASATHLLTVQVVSSALQYGGEAVTTGLDDGFASGSPAKNLLTSTTWPGLPLDSNGNPFLFLASGDTLQATYATALTTSDQINLEAVCADF